MHAVEPVIYAIVEGMVDESARILQLSGRRANNMHDWDTFSVCAGNGVEGG